MRGPGARRGERLVEQRLAFRDAARSGDASRRAPRRRSGKTAPAFISDAQAAREEVQAKLAEEHKKLTMEHAMLEDEHKARQEEHEKRELAEKESRQLRTRLVRRRAELLFLARAALEGRAASTPRHFL